MNPIATNVTDPRTDPFGPVCKDCGSAVYVGKIERGPKIGVRVTYRHVTSKCNKVPGLAATFR